MTEDRFVTEPALWRSVGRAALLGLLVGGALEVVGLLMHARTAPVLLFGLPVTAAVLLQLVRVAVADLPAPAPVPAVKVGPVERFLQLRRLERQLDAANRDPATFDWNLSPVLARLAADRLYHRHGIRFEHEPDRARAIVGEQLWQILTASPSTQSRRPSRARLHELVQAIESI